MSEVREVKSPFPTRASIHHPERIPQVRSSVSPSVKSPFVAKESVSEAEKDSEWSKLLYGEEETSPDRGNFLRKAAIGSIYALCAAGVLLFILSQISPVKEISNWLLPSAPLEVQSQSSKPEDFPVSDPEMGVREGEYFNYADGLSLKAEKVGITEEDLCQFEVEFLNNSGAPFSLSKSLFSLVQGENVHDISNVSEVQEIPVGEKTYISVQSECSPYEASNLFWSEGAFAPRDTAVIHFEAGSPQS